MLASGDGEKEKDFTTFFTSRGVFRFWIMPFGFVNVPATSLGLCEIAAGPNQMMFLCHWKDWKEHLSAS